MSTLKLYDIDAYTQEFSAAVIKCEESGGEFKTVLDKTAFFPEGGGQKSDTGYIEDSFVHDVQIENDIIYHFTDKPFAVGQKVYCKINFPERFRKMQIHTGEHIVSGVVHSLYGLNNVGFHLGTDEVTLDFNAELTREQLDKAESIANEIIYKNVPILCYYPDKNEIENIEYRSKKEVEGNLRIVEIRSYDKCACCAPHVSHTGEVGIIKLTHFEKNKGGTRITLLCGPDALDDYREKYRNVSVISTLLCARPDETAVAVENLLNEKSNLAAKITSLRRSIISLKSEMCEKSDKPIILFEKNLNINDMRNYANALILKRPFVCIFSHSEHGYNFVCLGENMKVLCERLKERFDCKCGGSDKMIQGSVFANEKEIKDFLVANIDKTI